MVTERESRSSFILPRHPGPARFAARVSREELPRANPSSGRDLDYHELALDGGGEGFGYIWTGDQARLGVGAGFPVHRARLDGGLIAPHPEPLRIDPRLAGAHVEFPAVPGTAHDLAGPSV